MRYGPGAVKVLVCCENGIVGDAVALSLSKAGHQSVASSDPLQLASNLAGADALVVDGKVFVGTENRITKFSCNS